MHILITNDDGIGAAGLCALEAAVSDISDCMISVVAPAREQSMCGHCVTTRRPLEVRKHQGNRWSVDGPSADCVRVALFGLGMRPDWILSGVNSGGNMGQDILISGTLAAAREGAYHGIKSIAFSHYLINGLAMDWPRVTDWTKQLFEHLRILPMGDGELWNVNFPHHPPGELRLPELHHCHPARSPLNVSYEVVAQTPETQHLRYNAAYSQRPRDPGSDVDICFGGAIAISKLRL